MILWLVAGQAYMKINKQAWQSFSSAPTYLYGPASLPACGTGGGTLTYQPRSLAYMSSLACRGGESLHVLSARVLFFLTNRMHISVAASDTAFFPTTQRLSISCHSLLLLLLLLGACSPSTRSLLAGEAAPYGGQRSGRWCAELPGAACCNKAGLRHPAACVSSWAVAGLLQQTLCSAVWQAAAFCDPI
jgi:hypothetical protein